MDYMFSGDKFTIADYDIKKSFSNFLPGIAGLAGTPFWCFYVNRGQGIAGFGVKDKNCPIMEFSPASIAYSRVGASGFRTFIKADGKYIEPFAPRKERKGLSRVMEITASGLSITETDKIAGLETSVVYFALPEKPFPALMRKTTVKNIGKEKIEIEILDGLSEIIPFGLSNADYKAVGNLFRAWMCAKESGGVKLFSLRSSTADSAEVKKSQGEHFFASRSSCGGEVKIVNPKIVFGSDLSKIFAEGFINNGIKNCSEKSTVFENELPCAFTYLKSVLERGKAAEITSATGTLFDTALIQEAANSVRPDTFGEAFARSKAVVEAVTAHIDSKTSNERFDKYIKQCFLDNVLRGGMPVVLDDKKDGVCYYVYSRKHGDLERDYNWFEIDPAYYSNGNGNFRDVLQNRRSDIYFFDKAGIKNLEQFVSLIQADGGNPLSVNGVKFVYEGTESFEGEAARVLSREFTYGELFALEKSAHIKSAAEILKDCREEFKAKFTEGYWTDHFVYLTDLLDAYDSVYPDKTRELLLGTKVRTFLSPAQVLPQSEKILLKDGVVRRYGAIDEKATHKREKEQPSCWAADETGKTLYTSIASKLFNLIAIKAATLDPDGLGLDMEADKPGWNDAMNGLPALFGSSVTDLIELKRLCLTLDKLLEKCAGDKISMNYAQYEFYVKLKAALIYEKNEYFFKSNALKEELRERLYKNETGVYTQILAEEAAEFLKSIILKIENNHKIFEGGLIPTYLCYEAASYEKIRVNGKDKISHYGLPCVRVTFYKQRVLPAFLESEAKYLYLKPSDAKKHYALVKDSGMYDKQLKVFKTSETLAGESHEIGRIRSFVPGWLERESCFLHMDYKFMLGLLRSGLYDEFFEEAQTNFVCNMDASKYGRNILENSTFIATSNHCDPDKTGQGFQPRLTGANPEMLTMLITIATGGELFKMRDGGLVLEPSPKIHKAWFGSDKKVVFKFYRDIPFIYYNPSLKNTYDENVVLEITVTADGKTEKFGSAVAGEAALKIRDGKAEKVEITIL